MAKLLISIYSHPEAYPPTLNAITELSELFNEITVLYRPQLKGDWVYPVNVEIIESGKIATNFEQDQLPLFRKVFLFSQFVWSFYKLSKKLKPEIVLLYDPIPILAYSLIKPFINNKHKLWYHSHDVSEIKSLRKFSIGWFANKVEKRIFNNLDLFTLPAASRVNCFPVERLKGKLFVIPNYPSIKFYNKFRNKLILSDEVKLIFQGRIGEGHGIENIICLLNEQIQGKSIKLILKGYCSELYQQRLIDLAIQNGVKDKLIFYKYSSYSEVPKIASTCNIGIAIFSKKELMHLTLGTSSNKIYEYAALGLPVIYSREEHFIKYLDKFPWAIDIEDNPESIKEAIIYIINNYEELSKAALDSFQNELNFETHFNTCKLYIKDLLHCI